MNPRFAGVASIETLKKKLPMRWVFILTVLGAVSSLTLAVWPGLLEDTMFAFPCFLLTLPAVSVWLLIVAIVGVHDVVPWQSSRRGRGRLGLCSALITVVTFGMLGLHAPQRIVFAFCERPFRELIAVKPRDGDRIDLVRQIGPYRIDSYGSDTQGGLYFRTRTGPDGIGPDVMSHGFAYRPKGAQTPFGRAKYRQRLLLGSWYVFAVSDDW